MKRVIYLLVLQLLFLSATKLFSQANVLNPADPDVVFTTAYQPSAPAYNNINIIKWGHASRLSWNPYSYGYRSYIYQGMPFRLKFPKTYQHNVADGKKYPLFIFFHGLGEKGDIYDNEYQLLHGGQVHAQNVDNANFDGFLFYFQSASGNSQDYEARVSNLIDSLVKYVKVDIDRVIVSGLSAGGSAAWDILSNDTYNKKIASSIPISAASLVFIPYFPQYITVPIWITNGGQDASPAPYTVDQVIKGYKDLGGKIDRTFFPSLGHGVWDYFWATPGYFQYLATQNKTNPLVFFQRNQFCPTDSISAKLGLHPGFFAYEWNKEGITISGANTNNLNVTQYGTYRGRYKRTSISAWSAWSPIPVVISQKPATVTPPIQINGMFSSVLPSPDGQTTVPLMVPANYAAYEWRRLSDTALVSSTSTYNAPAGQYKAMVTEQYGCSSSFSAPFAVIAANGLNVPDNITDFTGVALNSSSIRLDWNDNPTPTNNETAFEIFRSITAGSGYFLISKTGADVLSFTDSLLLANTTYYYIIRPINLNGAAAVSNQVTVSTKKDVIAPTAPPNLKVTSTTRSSVSLAWDAASDDVGVYKYDIYINGIKAYITDKTSININNLTAFQTYGFYVVARDLTGNLSPQSNQVSASTVLNGLTYKYYQGAWNVLPDFNSLTPVKTGNTPNVDISLTMQATNYGFLWEGVVKIPVTGSYTFETSSDDGSKLYIGTYNNNSVALVNNDGLHGTQNATGTITLNAGTYPIAITFFQLGGGANISVYWQSAIAGIARQVIPNSAFGDTINIPSSSLPLKPSNLAVNATSYNNINLSWNDNSNNESGFEITRSTSLLGAYVNIGTTSPNTTSFVDSTGLSPATKYWYKVRSVNQYGQSEFVSNLLGSWGFNNDYNDGSGNNRNLTAVGSPVFTATDKKEGTYALSLNGTNQYADMAFSSGGKFPGDSCTARSIGVWIKPVAATISGANKIIYDFGGADNGIALRFNSGSLQVGIASYNVRATVVLNNVTTNSQWILNGWNHVSVVYNVNVIQLFLNGVMVASGSLPFNSVGASSTSSRIGASNSTNAFNSSTSATNYSGLIDDVVIVSEPVSSVGISALMTQSYTADTTFPLPGIPVAPSGLVSTSKTTTTNSLAFNDNSSNETSFEIYRSVGNINNYRLLKSLGAGVTTTQNFTDSNLFANTNYYYKVKAIGVGGSSAFTNDLLVTTADNLPVFSTVGNFTMRYNSQKDIIITATDVDSGALVLSFVNPLPSFASFTILTNGSGKLHLNPQISDQGVDTISVLVTDANQGTNTLTFTFTVNDNYLAIIQPLADSSVKEGSNSTIPLTANRQSGNSTLVWSLTSAPSFVILTDNGNGAGVLNITPGYANDGIYLIKVTCSDGAGGNVPATFMLTVTDVIPVSDQKLYTSMKYNSADAPSPWNNISSTSTSGLLNSKGVATPIGIDFTGTSWNAGNAGAITGNNSGVYPDAVIKDYFWFGAYGAPETVDVNFRGLTTAAKYNVTVFGSSAWQGLGNNGTTNYTINGVIKPLYVDNNQQNTVTFSSITPNASGIINLNLSKGTGAPYGMVNAIVIEKQFDDGTTPVLPGNFSAVALSNGTVKLSWKDIAYNEDQYLVYRSTDQAGPFLLLSPAANANDTTYIDASVFSGTTYYYQIEASNAYGTSGKTGLVSALTGNRPPVINPISDFVLKASSNGVVNIIANDGPGKALTLMVKGLPSFASFANTGNGLGTITFSPSGSDQGIYKNIIVSAIDSMGASVSDTFSVSVIEAAVRSVYVNFGVPSGVSQSAPWNNFQFYPSANSSLGALKDDANINTSFSVTLQQAWQSNWSLGMITGDNSGIFPDNVLQGSIVTPVAGSFGIQLAGLNPSKKYNVVFLSSLNAGRSQKVTFQSVVQTVTQEARYNTNVSVQLNGLMPTPSGTLVVTAIKDTAAAYLNLNAMVIQEYNVGTPLVKPFYLFAESVLDSNKVKLTWSDRSDNETGFEIYSSTSLQGGYTLLATTSINGTTYTHSGLSANLRYYYKVRAINATETSDYSNIASLVTPFRIVFVNLNSNAAQNASAPWNNTTGQSTAGSTFSNLIDNTKAASGIDMVITKDFNAPGYTGVTSNGVFPGVVMQSNYWTDAGMVSQVKFSNLDIRKKYKIGCFGSAIHSSYSIAVYTCNGKMVQLNSVYNDSKIVYLKDLTSTDGDLIVSVRTLTGNPYSFTSAFTIDSYDDPTPYQPILFNDTTNNLNSTSGARFISPAVIKVKKDITSLASIAERTYTNAKTGINVYPNPFTNKIEVELFNDKLSVVTVLLYDLNSRLLYKTMESKQLAGKSKITVNLPSNAILLPGNYVISILVDGKLSKSVKLIKVQ